MFCLCVQIQGSSRISFDKEIYILWKINMKIMSTAEAPIILKRFVHKNKDMK